MRESGLEKSVWQVPREGLSVLQFLELSGYYTDTMVTNRGRVGYVTKNIYKKDSERSLAWYHQSTEENSEVPEIVQLLYDIDNIRQVSESLELKELLVKNGVGFEELNEELVAETLRKSSQKYRKMAETRSNLADRISKF